MTSGVGFAEQNMAYCPMFGCLSDNKKNREEKNIHFFAFPRGHSREQQTRRKIWSNFVNVKLLSPLKTQEFAPCTSKIVRLTLHILTRFEIQSATRKER